MKGYKTSENKINIIMIENSIINTNTRQFVTLELPRKQIVVLEFFNLL